VFIYSTWNKSRNKPGTKQGLKGIKDQPGINHEAQHTGNIKL
jgi:hypothetical protein